MHSTYFSISTIYQKDEQEFCEIVWWPEDAKSTKEASKLIACAAAELEVQHIDVSGCKVQADGLHLWLKPKEITPVMQCIAKFYTEAEQRKRTLTKCKKKYKKFSISKNTSVISVPVDIMIVATEQNTSDRILVELNLYNNEIGSVYSSEMQLFTNTIKLFTDLDSKLIMRQVPTGYTFKLFLPPVLLVAFVHNITTIYVHTTKLNGGVI